MANRINLGGEYENDEGETRYRHWIDVSNSTMNEVNAIGIENDLSPNEVLTGIIEHGSVEAYRDSLSDENED